MFILSTRETGIVPVPLAGSTPAPSALKHTRIEMKSFLNWRQWVRYALFAGCFLAFLMMCDETDNTMSEFIGIRIKALALMLVCGYPLGKLTKKWEREGKIKMS